MLWTSISKLFSAQAELYTHQLEYISSLRKFQKLQPKTSLLQTRNLGNMDEVKPYAAEDTSTFASSEINSNSTPLPEYKTSSSFRCLNATDISIGDLIFTLPSPTKPTNPLFYIRNSSFTPSLPSVTLRSSSKDGPILGILRLSLLSSKQNTFALGDPAQPPSAQGLNFESLRRIGKWTHNVYEWDCGSVEGRKRTFRWVKTKLPVLADQPDLELREVVGRIGDEKGEVELGEVMAVFEGCQKLFKRERGTFWVRRDEERRETRGESGEINGEEGWSEWELMVLLTGCGVIEGHRRRARSRRSG